ncbi:hypothetical protein MHU86_13518 [Fragilaria crotonensis]|nr:hypothetical protein MHU86_13518 [Fragilaria crotonensis]
MVLQLEDCVVVVKTLYYPQMTFYFTLNTCAVTIKCQTDDALKAEGMNTGYGDEQNISKESIIKGVDGYLGLHNHNCKLNVGDVQSMVFPPSDNGSYRMTPVEQHQQTRKDNYGKTLITKECSTSHS